MQSAILSKERADHIAVMGVQADFGQKVTALQTQALTQKGHNALDNKAYYDQFDQLLKGAQSQLKNDTQRYIFAQQTAHEKNQFSTSLERHAAQQMQALGVENANALVQTDMQKLSTLYRDPEAFDQQLKRVQAHELDSLEMQGLKSSDPAAAARLTKIKSDAQVDRIKQMMVENPAEAQHIYEVHQDEIEPHQRESIQHSLRTASDAFAVDGIIAKVKEKYINEDPNKEISPDEMYEEVKNQTSDPHKRELAFKEIERIARVRNQGIKQRFDKASGTILMSAHKDWDNYQETSTQAVRQSKEFLSLPEDEQAKVMDKVESENWKIHEHKARMVSEERTRQSAERREAKAAESEARRTRREKEDQNYNFYQANPEALAQMTDDEFLGLAKDVSHTDYKSLIAQRKKVTSPAALAQAKVDSDMLTGYLNKAGITNSSDVKKYGDMARHYVNQIQKDAKHELTPKEKEAALIQGLQSVAVNYNTSRLGFKTGSETHVVRRMEVNNPKSILPVPDDINKRFDTIESQRGITLTPERRQELYAEMLKEKGVK